MQVSGEVVSTVVVGVVTFFMGIVFSWAKKGSKHCENHQEFLLSIDRMSNEITRLLTSGGELFKKIDKLTDKQVSLEQRVCILELHRKEKDN